MSVISRSGKYVKLIVYLVVIVLVAMVSQTLFFRIDLTGDKIYSISQASKEVVATLSEPLTINVFFTKNLPAPHNNTEQYLRDLLEEYDIHAGKHNSFFNYRFFDVSPETEGIGKESEENQKLARSYGINPVQIRHVEQDEIKFKNAYMGLVLIHGDIIEKIPTITSTDGLEYQLTTVIQKLNNKISTLLALPEKIRIKLFMSSSLEQVAPFMGLKSLPDLPGQVEAAVVDLNAKNYGKLEYAYFNPSETPGLEKEMAGYNIMSLKWPALAEGKIDPGEGVIGMVMAYGDKVVEIPLLSVLKLPLIGTRYELINMEELDELINENVESLIDINENIGYLADHGTYSLSGGSPMNPMAPQQNDGLSNFNTLISRNYSFRQINLKEEAIPESLNCLVIARPMEPFTEYELFQIDQHLMRGKSLAVFVDAFNEVMPQGRQAMAFNQGPTYIPFNTGLEKLLDHYGVRVKKSYVLDENCYKQVLPQQFGGGERAIYFAPLIQQEFINSDLPFMKNIKGLVAMKVSPLALNDDRIKQNNITAHQVFASSEKSWEMKGRINLNPLLMRPPTGGEERGSLPISYLLEGEFPSYYAGKSIPEKAVKKEEEDKDIAEIGPDTADKGEPAPDPNLSKIEGKGTLLTKSKPARIFLLASGEMLKNNILDEAGKGPNATLIMNVIDTLNNRDDIALMRSKEQQFNPLGQTDASAKTMIKTFNIAGLPVLVILFGLFVWLKRHARRKNIQEMFQK